VVFVEVMGVFFVGFVLGWVVWVGGGGDECWVRVGMGGAAGRKTIERLSFLYLSILGLLK
jgi:hypothetical protein